MRKLTGRIWIAGMMLGALCSPVRLPAQAGAATDQLERELNLPAGPKPDDKVDQAVARGIVFLLSQQDDQGGFWDRGRGQNNVTAMTALSIMALGATGHQPTDDSKEGEAMSKALGYVLRDDRQENDGYFGNRDGSRMYGHGIITLALAEMLGMGAEPKQDQLIRDRLQKGIDLILRSQRVSKPAQFEGGWRYAPQSSDADLSVSVWQVMALRAAKNAGLDVPKEAIDKAVAYLKRSYQSGRDAAGNPTNPKSACAYQPGGGPSYAMGSAGLLALQVCGQYETPEVVGSADWLRDQKLAFNWPFFFYGTYYYAQGMYQRGGEHAAEARQQVTDVLLAHQAGDGSWAGQDGHESGAGKVYATSLAILSLSVRYHYLPIYQR